MQRNWAKSISLFDCGGVDVDSSLWLCNYWKPQPEWPGSIVFAAGRMVDFPGSSVSGAVASFFFILLSMRQPGGMPFFPLPYTQMSQQYSPHAEFQIKRARTILGLGVQEPMHLCSRKGPALPAGLPLISYFCLSFLNFMIRITTCLCLEG